MKRKKIALATCFLDNYGACLQAFALQSAIERLGFSCEILAYVEPDGYRSRTWKTKLRSSVKWAAAGILPQFHDYRRTHSRERTCFDRFRKTYLRFHRQGVFGKIAYYTSAEQMRGLSDSFDAFVCGSDQIWNPTFYNQNNPVYFLQFVHEKPRIAYSPSIGLSAFPEPYAAQFVRYVRSFDAVSVREAAGAQIIRELCGIDARVVLDPTLLVGGDFWRQQIRPGKKRPYEKYILCYIFSNTDRTAAFVRAAQKQIGLPIVYFPVSELMYPQRDTYCVDNADPMDFLRWIAGAEYVLTDSFHGTAFSLLLHKAFFVFQRERDAEAIDMFSRLRNVLDMTGLSDRLVSFDQPLPLDRAMDFDEADRKLEAYRQDSLLFLKTALETRT